MLLRFSSPDWQIIWYIYGMKSGIDSAGRVVIPVEIRRRARLEPGTEVELSLAEDGSVRLVRRVPGPRLVKVGRRLVARPTVSSRSRPQIDVAALIEEERNRWPW
jgi:AbrB family looped-hinge helix DNA binding protein